MCNELEKNLLGSLSTAIDWYKCEGEAACKCTACAGPRLHGHASIGQPDPGPPPPEAGSVEAGMTLPSQVKKKKKDCTEGQRLIAGCSNQGRLVRVPSFRSFFLSKLACYPQTFPPPYISLALEWTPPSPARQHGFLTSHRKGSRELVERVLWKHVVLSDYMNPNPPPPTVNKEVWRGQLLWSESFEALPRVQVWYLFETLFNLCYRRTGGGGAVDTLVRVIPALCDMGYCNCLRFLIYWLFGLGKLSWK